MARLFAEMLALNQSSAMRLYWAVEASCRSSGSTREMPRASRPARDSIRAFHCETLRRRGESSLAATVATDSVGKSLRHLECNFNVERGK